MPRLLLIALALALMSPAASAQSGYAVDRAAPAHLAAPTLDLSQPHYKTVQATFTVTSTDDAGPGTLRQAILDANATDGLDEIAFNIGGGGSYQEIFLQTALPFVTQPITMDGATQGCDTSEGLCIRIDGGAIPLSETFQTGFAITGGASTFRGLVLTRFGQDDVDADAAITLASSNNVVAGCYFGTDRTGMTTDPDGTPGSGDELGNGFGVAIRSQSEGTNPTADNLVGGEDEGDRNVISASVLSGVLIRDARTRANRVVGNYIGTDANGAAALPNGEGGVIAALETSRNTIEGNLISGNTERGINLQEGASENVITGNLIGTDATGMTAIPNGTLAGLVENEGLGVAILGGRDNIIADNLISGNLLAGVLLGTVEQGQRIVGNRVSENLIGTDITGVQPLPNGVPGVPGIGFGVVMFASGEGSAVVSNVIGGDSMEDANVIGFNTTAGIGAQGLVADNIINHNYIGLTPTFDAIPNGFAGILLRNGASRNVIGSETLSDEPGNAIAFQSVGISIGGEGAFLAQDNAILYNRFAGPTGQFLPVDLGLDGPTANDPGDADVGDNNLQNSPSIESAPGDEDEVTVNFRIDTDTNAASYPLRSIFYVQSDEGGITTFEPIGETQVEGDDAQTLQSATFDLSDFDFDDVPTIVGIATDFEGSSSEMTLVGVTVPAEPGAPEASGVQIAPNPTAGAARFTFALDAAEDVTLAVYDALGREVATLARGPHGAGEHTARLSAGLAPGVYLWRLASGERVESGRFTVVR